MRLSNFLYVTILIALAVVACKENPQKKYEKAVMELSGKTILFPDSMRTIFGEKVEIPNTEYTIVAYFDSVGCTVCRMKLPYWIDFMKKTDSIVGNNNVSLLLITGSHNLNKVRQLVKQVEFPYPVINDSAGIFSHLNSIPEDSNLQTLLLDTTHKVLLIGNPTQSKVMQELYINQFSPSDATSYDLDGETIEEFDFGLININEKVSHTFRLTNSYPDTLYVKDIISSCECTTAEISSAKIAPGDSFNVTVTFRDSVSGDFLRSVTLKYQDSIPQQILEISGYIK